MSAVEAVAWASEVGAPEMEGIPPLPSGAADLLGRLDFPIPPAAGASRLLPPRDGSEAA